MPHRRRCCTASPFLHRQRRHDCRLLLPEAHERTISPPLSHPLSFLSCCPVHGRIYVFFYQMEKLPPTYLYLDDPIESNANCTRRCRSPSHGTRAAPGYVRAIALAPKTRGTEPKQQVLTPKKERIGSFLLKQAVLCWAKVQRAEEGSADNLLTVWYERAVRFQATAEYSSEGKVRGLSHQKFDTNLEY
jgi:hypothetical protein